MIRRVFSLLAIALPAIVHAQPSAREMPAGITMVSVPAGSFEMGNTGRAAGDANERPGHRVRVGAFTMSRTEITQREFSVVMGYNPSRNRGDGKPVETVSWYDAVRFSNALSEREGLRPAYQIDPFVGYTVDSTANGYRLPTEAEWEYAARAGTNADTYAGSITTSIGRDPVLDPIAWYRSVETVDDTTHHVALKQPNAFGLFDMIGNVFEWTDAQYAAYPGATLQKGAPGTAEAASLKVLRGGAIDTAPGYSRVAYRYMLHPSYTSYNIGFRVVRSMRP